MGHVHAQLLHFQEQINDRGSLRRARSLRFRPQPAAQALVSDVERPSRARKVPGAGKGASRRDTVDPRAIARSVDDYLKAVSTFERMLHGAAPNSVHSLVSRGDALTALGEYESAWGPDKELRPVLLT